MRPFLRAWRLTKDLPLCQLLISPILLLTRSQKSTPSLLSACYPLPMSCTIATSPDPEKLRPLLHAELDRLSDEHLGLAHRALLQVKIPDRM